MQVNAIQKRARYLVPIRRHTFGTAAAVRLAIAKIAAGARIHRRHQLKSGGKIGLTAGT
jgi:hypothetical protein